MTNVRLESFNGERLLSGTYGVSESDHVDSDTKVNWLHSNGYLGAGPCPVVCDFTVGEMMARMMFADRKHKGLDYEVKFKEGEAA